MKSTLKLISFLALALIIVPPVLYLATAIEKSFMITLMLFGTIGWFATVPFWMGKKA